MSGPMTPEDLQGRGDVAEAALRGVSVVYVYGYRALPPRLRGVWRFLVPLVDLPRLDRSTVGAWIAANSADQFSRVLDWAAVGPEDRLPWSMHEAAEVFRDGLS